MQLARLEIKGFKSFADKVVIHFDEGITGIVGPNGCGKSNIVDAIRWVLGEQKTSALRSEKMENVIFNGTSGRSPLQMAEVSLTINNTKNILPTEYAQVTITRRLYRSGESEYLLNGVLCRLKDITNLFMDTGVASNSYAIIELGMVDDLLNDKDNSRRMLFEEAAGISKFKKRKKESLKKLEDTDADLERVEDLLYEIDKNMKSLERQARQTEQYYKTKEEYKQKSIDLAKLVLSRQNAFTAEIQKKIEEETDRKTNLTSASAELEARIEAAKAELVIKEKNLAARQREINEFVNQIRQYENEKQIKNERLRYLTNRVQTLQEQVEQDRQGTEQARLALESLELECEAAHIKQSESEKKLQELRSAYDEKRKQSAVLQEQAELERSNLRKKQEASYEINKAIEIREIQIASFRQELERTASDSTQQSASLAEFEKKLIVLEEEIKQRTSELDRLKQEEIANQTQISTLEKNIEVVREEMTSITRKLDSRQNEYNLTKSLVDNLEGFPEAIKFLRKKIMRNAPLLSDVLTCPEEYRVAIENYLEPYLNYYIVEQEAEAFEAINILSDASKGKANFFILSAFEKFEASPTRIYDNAYPVTQVIEFDPKYRKLMSYILDKVYICEGDIKSIPPDDDNTFITKSGKFTRRRFSLSGGSVGLFEGKRIGRARHLEKLEKEIKELTSRLEEVRKTLLQYQAELEKLRNSNLRNQIEEVQASLRQVKEEFISIRTKRDQFAEMISHADLRREDILEKIEALLRELDELRPRAQQQQLEVVEQEQRLTSLLQELAQQNEALAQQSTLLNEQNILFHQAANRVKSLEQEIRFKQETITQNARRIEQHLAELKQNEEEIRQISLSSQSRDEELISMYTQKDELEKALNETEQDYYRSRGDVDQLEKEVRELHHSRQRIDELLMQLQNQLNESRLHLNSVRERMAVEFQVDLDAMDIQPAGPEGKETDEEKLRQEVTRLREKLDNMGPVNPMAMEAYQEIKQRSDFILAQKEDLVKAKESLINTISEIETVASQTFMDAFNKIRAHFKNVFRSLFNEEDDCDIRLVNPENPLDSEIEIIAKPKGKRPLTINQLSGGEKTLTAIALLFSMYLLKPAPFCIFDEVDAPLDDANIDKFNNIIRHFSKDSQFVIVTHNKRTMTATDVIYGITMVEKGVSRVVPVDLRELA
jgi:chromosome segregation protein